MPSTPEKIYKKDTIVIASHNKGKIQEFQTLLSTFDVNIITPTDLGIGDIEETGSSFIENSKIKAQSIPTDFITIADDSGLCISSLNNNPGILSARYAKKYGGWYEAMENLYKEAIKKKPKNLSAKFVCSLTLRLNDIYYSYSGEVFGQIVWPPKGNNGFGYDPFFLPNGFNKTFAEMEHHKKIMIDHRSIALKKLIKEHLTYS